MLRSNQDQSVSRTRQDQVFKWPKPIQDQDQDVKGLRPSQGYQGCFFFFFKSLRPFSSVSNTLKTDC